MAYTALYRTQRPEVFSEIIGQDAIVRILKNQLETNTVSHAYLFCGTRGTGKTTTARILAKGLNCLDENNRPCGQCANCRSIKEGTFMDVIEIDAASNNGVDNIRELRESVKYPPAVGRKKIYIIDEVHMLTSGAANALLKTLEEPPENVIFILATTDPQKLPQTILSRCMRLDFKRVSENTLMEHMGRICGEKGVEVSESALRLLAANADGSVRDGLSILDQCLSAGDKVLDRELILEFLGTVSEDFFIQLTDRVLLHDVSGAFILLDEALGDGKDVKLLMKDWMSHYRNLLITKYIKNPEDMLNMSSDNVEKVRSQSNQISLDEINSGIITLSKTINDARYSPQPRILLELAIVTLATGLAESQPVVAKNQPVAHKPQPVPVKAPSKPMAQPRPEGRNFEGGAKAVSKAGASAAEAESRLDEDFDLDEIWGRVFEAAEKIRPSFNMIRTGTVLVAISPTEFKVIAQNEFIRNFVEGNQSDLCKIMEDITGRKRKLVCRLESGGMDELTNGQQGRDIANEIKNVLNLDIPVKME